MQATSFLLFSFAVLSSVSGDMYLRRTEESDEVTCERFDICNLVHNPRWGINSVEKLCKCPEDTYCPARFVPNDGFSLPVNYRTQMKFCTPLSDLEAELEMCEEDEVAIRVRTVYQIDQVKNVSARIMCNCNHDGPTYWRYHSRFGRSVLDDDELFEVIDNFQCSELQKCNANEFCGFARFDYGFIFQRCTCDTVHDCRFLLEESDVEEEIESELFYNGLMYKSRCIRNESFEHW